MEKKPKLSIIIPVYGVEQYLPRCFECLDKQDATNIEIIFVDDGSLDKSGALCDWYADNKEYVKVIHKKNGGLSDARNYGIKVAQGDYCLFLDSDDTLVPRSCDKIIELLNKNNLDVLYLEINWITSEKRTIYRKRGFKSDIILNGETALLQELKTGKYAAMAQMGIYRLAFLRENKLLFKKGILHEDEEWSPRVMMTAKTVQRSEFQFYNYYLRSGSITGKKNAKRYQDMIETIYELNEIYKESKNRELCIYGQQYLAKLYMNAASNLISEGKKISIDKKLVKGKMKNSRDKMKVFLFLCSPKLYLRTMENM